MVPLVRRALPALRVRPASPEASVRRARRVRLGLVELPEFKARPAPQASRVRLVRLG